MNSRVPRHRRALLDDGPLGRQTPHHLRHVRLQRERAHREGRVGGDAHISRRAGKDGEGSAERRGPTDRFHV